MMKEHKCKKSCDEYNLRKELQTPKGEEGKMPKLPSGEKSKMGE